MLLPYCFLVWKYETLNVWSSINFVNSSGQALHPALFILKIHFSSKRLKFLECHPPLPKQTQKRCQETGHFLLISSHSTLSLTMAGIFAFLRCRSSTLNVFTAPAHSYKPCLKPQTHQWILSPDRWSQAECRVFTWGWSMKSWLWWIFTASCSSFKHQLIEWKMREKMEFAWVFSLQIVSCLQFVYPFFSFCGLTCSQLRASFKMQKGAPRQCLGFQNIWQPVRNLCSHLLLFMSAKGLYSCSAERWNTEETRSCILNIFP